MSQLQIFHVTSLAQAAPGRQEAFNTFLVVKATQGVSQTHYSISFHHIGVRVHRYDVIV